MNKNSSNRLLYNTFFCAVVVFAGGIATSIFSFPGELDVSFNPTGTQPGTLSTTINNNNFDNEAYSVAIQTDGKIIAAGFMNDNFGFSQFALARFNPNGSLDISFNPTGTQPGTTSTTINNNIGGNEAHSVAIQTDGKIVAAGSTFDGTTNPFALARFNPDGSPDISFNPTGAQPGTVSTTINNDVTNGANSIALQTDGKIVAAGGAENGQFALARFNPDGSLDISFNPTGTQPGTLSTTINNNIFDNVAYSVAIQTDGKIVAAGYTRDNAHHRQFALARLNPNGSLDVSFNPTGAQPGTLSITINNNNFDNEAYSVAIQPDGKIVAAGLTNGDFALARFNPDGSLDISLNPTGTQPGTTSTTINNNPFSSANSVAIQTDGKIVAAGDTRDNAGNDQFALARFNPDGSLDISFNPTGTQPGTLSTTINNNNIDNEANSVAIQPDGKIVAAGYTNNGTVDQFALARFIGENVAAPTNLTAQKIYHRFPTQVDIINQLCWDPLAGAVAYNIYADAELTTPLATIASPTVCYVQHQICAGQTTTYYVTAIDANGNQSASASITI